jgi:hypothetical protein
MSSPRKRPATKRSHTVEVESDGEFMVDMQQSPQQSSNILLPSTSNSGRKFQETVPTANLTTSMAPVINLDEDRKDSKKSFKDLIQESKYIIVQIKS